MPSSDVAEVNCAQLLVMRTPHWQAYRHPGCSARVDLLLLRRWIGVVNLKDVLRQKISIVWVSGISAEAAHGDEPLRRFEHVAGGAANARPGPAGDDRGIGPITGRCALILITASKLSSAFTFACSNGPLVLFPSHPMPSEALVLGCSTKSSMNSTSGFGFRQNQPVCFEDGGIAGVPPPTGL